MSGMKFDTQKAKFDLIDPFFHEDLAYVLTFGAVKYGPNNWQQVEDAVSRYIAALERHANAFKQGEITDPESGLPHTAHIACNAMFLHWLKRNEQYNGQTTNVQRHNNPSCKSDGGSKCSCKAGVRHDNEDHAEPAGTHTYTTGPA